MIRGLMQWHVFVSSLLLCSLLPGQGLQGGPQTPKPDEEAGRPQVAQLLVDVDKTVRKQGAEAEIVFATLLTYDQQLELSLKKEMSTMANTVEKLTTMRASYTKEINATRAEVTHLGLAAEGSQKLASKYQVGTAQTSKKFDAVLGSVKDLVSILTSAAITPAGTLVMQKSGTSSDVVYARIRRLLETNKKMQPQYPDVFTTFTESAKPAKIGMNPALLGRTIDALKLIQSRLQGKRSEALVQLQSWERKLSDKALSAEANADQVQGVEAEKEEKIEELSFSSTFTQAVLQSDQTFYKKVHDTMKKKADLVDAIRHARQTQVKTLTDLIDLLDGRYTVEDRLAPLNTAFLQVHETNTRARRPQISNLQFEIETALQHKADTHAILLRVKAMLDESKFDAGSLQDVETDMKDVLTTVNYEQSRAADAKQKCESQRLHALQEDRSLKANLALMNSVRNDTRRAIRAARANLKGIKAKTQALKKLSHDFTRTVGQAMSKLEGQSKDRSMIITAVQMAAELASGRGGGKAATVAWTTAQKSAATALLREMNVELQQQEDVEKAYRAEVTAFRGNLLLYVQDYTQLLKERRAHYESAISALELYSTEVAADATLQSDSASTGTQLAKESSDLCETILKFYEHHNRRRQDLSDALHRVLPKVPDVLSRGGDATQDGWDDIQ